MYVGGNIKVEVRERERVGGMEWTDLDQDRDQWRALVYCVHGNEPSGSVKWWEILE
jgi:hypothetical protein